MAAKRHAPLELRDAAYEAAVPAHSRMENEISLYRNEDYTGESWIKRFKRSVTRSISPQINTVINRLIPIFTEQMAHVNVDPIRSDTTELGQLASEELQEHLDSLEAVDAETEELRTLILRNQTMGNAISKIICDPDSEMVRAVPITPLRFAPAPDVSRSDFRGGGYVVHTTYHNYMTISKKYPGAQVPNKRFNDKELMGGNIRGDEMQMTGDGEKLKAIQTALSMLEVPQSLRAKYHHKDPYENFAQLQKWADPNLLDPAGNSYNQQYTIGDLKKLFGAT